MNTTQKLDDFLYAMKVKGYVVLEKVLSASIVEQIRQSLSTLPKETKYKNIVWNLIDKLPTACVESLIENETVLPLIDSLLGDTCVVFSFNAVPLQPGIKGTMADYHRDSGRYIPAYDYAFNVFFAISDFTRLSGGTLLVPGTHDIAQKPSDQYIRENAVQIEAPAGSAIILNSNLWHASGENRDHKVRWGANVTYVRSFMRQQFDFPQAVAANVVEKLSERSRQLLGFYVRMPKSLQEYSLPDEQRLYRSGQG
jgi:ectoine hydroxylase-related dioxygenase (phytanoyl-CoA dioxygenase family)